MAQRGRREISAGVLLLAYQIFANGYNTIPPVTLLTIAAQTAIFLGFIPFLDYYRIGEICVLPSRVWRFKEWKRLLFSSFVHGDDMHLYYNMVSFMWKGRRLERKFGPYYFAYLLAVFSILTNVVLVTLSLFVDNVWKFGLSQQCAVGFSGVIFALKILCNHYFPNEDSFIFGWFPVPSQFACWAELLLIQLLVPNASFVGHLAGILVGLAYVQGPLKYVMDILFGTVSATFGNTYRRESGSRSYRPRREDYVGQGNQEQQDNRFYRYTAGLTEEEQLRRAMDESVDEFTRRSQPSAPPFTNGDYNRLYPDVR